MAKTDNSKKLKSCLKNTNAKLKRREEKIARLEAKIAQMEESKKKMFVPSYGPSSPEYSKKLPGHQFSEFVVRYAITLRCETNCSTRDIVTAIERLADLTFGLVDYVPSYNTIDNWVRKCGLHELKQTPEALKDVDYAAIIDECMMIGNEKLLPVLAVPSEHQGHPLQLGDIRVIGFNVKPGWNAETVQETLEANINAVGKKPEYVITDNDHKMRKAISLSGNVWHRDISHTLAMFMERVYKDDAEFKEFNDRVETSKKQNCMKEIAYLQSPSQRAKARFMNLSDKVEWANTMLYMFDRLTPDEQYTFSFIPSYASFIEEMKDMVSYIHYIEKAMKHNGLSKKTIAACRRHTCVTFMRGNDRMRKVGQQILDYLMQEERLLKDDEVVHNSSDIIESAFGIFKYIQSPNKLNGVTTLILHLPIKLSLFGRHNLKSYDVKESLCQTRVKDITQWRDDNLLENLVSKRIRVLKAG